MNTNETTDMEIDSSGTINVGASKEVVIEARKSIIEILNSGAEQETLRCALLTYKDICAVSQTIISNNIIN